MQGRGRGEGGEGRGRVGLRVQGRGWRRKRCRKGEVEGMIMMRKRR